MTRYTLKKTDAGYYWEGSSCWGGSNIDGFYMNRNDALISKPFAAGNDWRDATGDGADAPRTYTL